VGGGLVCEFRFAVSMGRGRGGGGGRTLLFSRGGLVSLIKKKKKQQMRGSFFFAPTPAPRAVLLRGGVVGGGRVVWEIVLRGRGCVIAAICFPFLFLPAAAVANWQF